MHRKHQLGVLILLFLTTALTSDSSTLGFDKKIPSRLNPGEKLIAGDRLQNGLRFVAMQGDGNFVMYTEGGRRSHWSSNTNGNDGAELVMQGDGNLVIYSSTGEVLWETATTGNYGSWLELQVDGNLVINGAVAIWDSDTKGYPGAVLIMQADGNLVIYDTSGYSLWSTNTHGNPGAYYSMQEDGNLVVNDVNGGVLWSSETNGNAGAWLQMQDDGNLVIYSIQSLWSTETHPIPWMESARNRISDTPLRELAIPGTHESATYELVSWNWGDDGNLSEFEFGAIFTLNQGYVHGWATAQSKSIAAQLKDGIRYIDLRIIDDDGNKRAIHTIMGTSLSDITREIRDFTEKNPLEIVILDFQALFKMDGAELWDAVQSDLGDKLVPHPQNLNLLTVGDIWKMNKQIIAISDKPYPPMLWPRDDVLESKWPNKQSVGSLYDYIANKVISSPANNGKLWVVQGVVTPKPNFSSLLLDDWEGYEDLEGVADDVTPEVVSWMENWQGDAVWSTGTEGNPGARYEMQADGNLVVFSSSNQILWASNTQGNPGAWLQMQDDGNLVIYARGAIWSSNTPGNYGAELFMQEDGNLVILSQIREALWSSGTQGYPGAIYSMQSDGNLVVYDSSGEALWSSNTQGNWGATLAMQEDGNLVIYDVQGNLIWDSGTAGNYGAVLVMQSDGNLVIYGGRITLWSTETGGYPGAYYEMQTDGNLVVKTAGGEAIWSSNTPGNPSAKLAMQADGNLVIYAPVAIWDAATYGNPGAQLVMQSDGNLVVYGGNNIMNIVIADFYHHSNFVETAVRANRTYLGIITDVNDDSQPLPGSYTLAQNYPNPFNPTTTIKYSLPRSSHVTINIYNILGQNVTTLLDNRQMAGNHSLDWNGTSSTGQTVASGLYFYRLVTEDHAESRKMLLLK